MGLSGGKLSDGALKGHSLEGNVATPATSSLFASWLPRGKQLYPPQAPTTSGAVSSATGPRATDRAKQPWAGAPETVRQQTFLPLGSFSQVFGYGSEELTKTGSLLFEPSMPLFKRHTFPLCLCLPGLKGSSLAFSRPQVGGG